MVKKFWLIFYCLCPIITYAADRPFYFTAMGEYGITQAKGFNQIPRGGSQHSSSYRRPSFEELNIKNKIYHTFGFGVQFPVWKIAYNHSAIHLKNNVFLNESLFSHGLPLPSDIPYHFNITLNKQQIQFKKKLSNSASKKNHFYFNLFSNVDWLGYHYHFYPLIQDLSVLTPNSRRDFINLSCSIGSEFQYQWHPYFSSSISASTSLPFFHLHITEAKFIQHFHIMNKPMAKLTPYIALSYLSIDLQDKQGLANHLRFTANPYIFAGIEFLLI